LREVERLIFAREFNSKLRDYQLVFADIYRYQDGLRLTRDNIEAFEKSLEHGAVLEMARMRLEELEHRLEDANERRERLLVLLTWLSPMACGEPFDSDRWV
jgi:hypothetical protein